MSSGKKRVIIKTTKQFVFVRQERPGKKTWFEIHFNKWSLGASTWEEMQADVKSIDEMFQTKSHNKQPANFTWSFWKYEEADELFTLANLKWSI